MAIFEVEANGKTYEVDAPDKAAAVSAIGAKFGAAPPAPQPTGDVRKTALGPIGAAAGKVAEAAYNTFTSDPNLKWERAGLLPIAVNEKGDASFAVPGFAVDAFNAAKTLMSPEGQYRPGTDDARGVKLALEAGSLATPGTNFPAVTRAVAPKMAAPAAEALANVGERQGVQVPTFIASEGKVAPVLAGGLNNSLFGAPIVSASERMGQQIGAGVNRIAEGLAPGNAKPYGAGTQARNAMADWVKGGSKAEMEAAYAPLDTILDKSARVELGKTRAAAGELAARDIASASPDGQKVIGLIQDAINRPGGMTYEGIKELRTRIGDRLNGDIADPGMSQKMLSGVYAALSDDLKNAVIASGGKRGQEALAAFDAANATSQQIFQKRRQLGDIIGKDAANNPQAVFENVLALASSGRSGDISRLNLARQTMGQEAWNEVAAAALNRMGLDKMDKFSPARFTSAISNKNFDPAAKVAMFGKEGAAALDDLARLSDAWEKGQRYVNRSNTANAASILGAITAFSVNPLLLVAQGAGNLGMAAILARPATARAVATYAKTYAMAARNPNATVILQQAAGRLAADLAAQGAGDETDIRAALLPSASLPRSPASGPPGQSETRQF